MNNDIYTKKPGSGRPIAGIILLIIGGIFLLDNLNFVIAPWWLFRWPSILILVGLITGAKHNFRNTGSIIMILIGCAFLANDIFPDIDFGRFVWPLILMGIGAWIILGRNKAWGNRRNRRHWAQQNMANTEWDARVNPEDPIAPVTGDDAIAGAADATSSAGYTGSAGSSYSNFKSNVGDSFVDSTSVFGSVNKTILSKDFKGGDIVNVFGGTELNFTQADINGKVYIDVTQLFGGIKLIVPPHWQVVSDMAAVFAGIDDKRRPGTIALSPDKILILKGTSIFAGIEIRSY